ncbi:hypothetical protein A1351_17545 [Methylosinus sp. R-45379]|uniref:hypothetical protein n=1 Tax=Methylosinus sp. R-45379 TaxID=980563 RepID=UPI0007C92666|nr:hypothetical protein [Methylosinus sp. R-45379]OAI24671.1 hypothetical protein A1351_17545 [Methylosinus sp. R-45379]
MRSNFTPFTRLSAGGLMLAAAAADIGCAAAEPRRSHALHVAGAMRIEELGSPNGKGYDDIIVKLAPLVAAKPEKEARPAERPPAPALAAEAPKVAVAAPPPAESVKPTPALPVFLREPLPAFENAPVADLAKAPEQAVVATSAEPAPIAPPQAESAPQAAAPTAQIASPAAPEAAAVEAKAEAPVERTATPEAEADAPKGEAPAAEAAPAPSAEAMPPAQEENESPMALWQALVAAAALAGLLVMKYLRRGPPVAKAAEPGASKAVAPQEGEAAPAGRLAIALAAARAKFEPILAKFAALRGKKAAETAPQAEAAPQEAPKKEAPKKPKTMDWTEVAAALRARFAGGGKTAGGPTAAQSNRVIALVDSEGRGRASDSWDSNEDDGLELLEPGDASARTIVMNARRRLRSAQS